MDHDVGADGRSKTPIGDEEARFPCVTVRELTRGNEEAIIATGESLVRLAFLKSETGKEMNADKART
jgi:hypothetical protein